MARNEERTRESDEIEINSPAAATQHPPNPNPPTPPKSPPQRHTPKVAAKKSHRTHLSYWSNLPDDDDDKKGQGADQD